MQTPIKAIVFTDPGQIKVSEFTLSPCGPREIVVRTLYTLVSTGTELRILAGHYGAAENYPLIPGYSVVGEVIEVGQDAAGFRVGDLVSGRNPLPVAGVNSQWGGQASHHLYSTTGEQRPVLLPQGANPLDYVITEIAAISFRGVEAASPHKGDSAVVIGQGLIGAFSAAWLVARGCRVAVVDVEERRLELALKRGAFAAVNMRSDDAEERLKQLLNGGADIVIESSGTSAGVMLSYRLTRKKPQNYSSEYTVEPIGFYHGDWPRLVMQANYLETVTIDPFNFINGEGVTILAPKDRGVEDRHKTIEAIRRGEIRASDFIDCIADVNEAPEAYRRLRDDKSSNFSLVFDWMNAL